MSANAVQFKLTNHSSNRQSAYSYGDHMNNTIRSYIVLIIETLLSYIYCYRSRWESKCLSNKCIVHMYILYITNRKSSREKYQNLYIIIIILYTIVGNVRQNYSFSRRTKKILQLEVKRFYRFNRKKSSFILGSDPSGIPWDRQKKGGPIINQKKI